jgi:hypothetical protein
MTSYVGIDNGLDGGVATLFAPPADPGIGKAAMPTVKVGKGRVVDVLVLNEWAREWAQNGSTVIIEQATKHSAGKLALCSTWFTYGSIIACLKINRVRYHEITSPRTWQKEFWTVPKMAAGQKFDTKAAALAVVRKLWPTLDLRASERCSVPHDGIVDALLIAEYGRRKNL